MKKIIIILAVLILSLPAFAENAVVKETSGRVQVKAPGGSWKNVSEGDSIAKGSSISTGFGSSAVIEVGAATLSVDALTRIKLEELMKDQGAQTTGLFLRVGKVKANVKRDEGLSHNFKLRSPSSTAAVRGTAFSFDGINLDVERGLVAFIGTALGGEQLVAAGEQSQIIPSGKQSSPVREQIQKTVTKAVVEKTQGNAAQSGASQDGSTDAGVQSQDLYGSIKIKVEVN